MKRTCPFYFIVVFACCVLSACQTPPAADPLPAGLKITDLKDTTQNLEKADFLITFKVFQYKMDPNSVEQLGPLRDIASRSKIHFRDEAAFNANGFDVGFGTRDQVTEVARALTRAGAVRMGFTSLGVAPSETNILSSIVVGQTSTLTFASDGGRTNNQMFHQGYLGWTLFAESSAVRDTVIVKLAPAYWQRGDETIRILTGKEPIAFELFEFASFQTRMREGDFLVLMPARISSDNASLNQTLFVHGGKKPKAQCYIIFCESAGL